MSEAQKKAVAYFPGAHRNKCLWEVTFARAETRFGKNGVADLAGVGCYDTFLAMRLNMTRYRILEDSVPLPRLPE